MKNKLICLFLCTCLGLCLWGCDNDTKVAQSPSDKESSSESSPTNDDDDTLQPDVDNTQISTPDISPEALDAEQANDNTTDLANCNWNVTAFQLLGQKYRLPFSYARISDEWTFSLEDYGYDDTFRLQPGERTTATVELTNSTQDYTMVVGFYNPYDVEITIEESKVWSVSIDLTNSIATNLPYLPQNLTMGASLGDAILAYGNPSVPFTHDYDAHTFEYHYESDYNRFVTLEIHETEGLVKFTIQNYDF